MKRLLCLMLLAALMACGPRTPVETHGGDGPFLTVVPPERWPGLEDDGDIEDLINAAEISHGFFAARPADRVFSFSEERRTAAELARGLQTFIEILRSAPAGERKMRLQERFVLLRSVGRDGRGEVFFTGYFEPLLEGRRQRNETFNHPLFATPEDLLTISLEDFGVECSRSRLTGRIEESTIVPYWDRDAIDHEGRLEKSAEVLAWLDDPVEAFFLHVQGSGTIVFDDGSRVRAGYATTNGRPYRSIGKLLIDEDLVPVEDMSMQAIVAYLNEHPEEVRRVLGANPSYVFFRALPADNGPLGCYGEPLTAGRSIATDKRLFPGPVVAWVAASTPSPTGEDRPWRRFMLNQDTGGSIRGPGRVDLFYGLGDDAGDLAGRTKHYGELFFLLPRSDETPPS